MLIIAGSVTFANQADRDRFVAGHTDLLARARRAPGCLDVAITADPLDPCRANNYERWEDAEALDHWRAQANAPDLGHLIVDGDVWRFDVSEVRPPFD